MGFSNIHSDAKHQKIEGGPFEEKNFPKKSRSAEKKLKGDTLVSPGMVCYAGKQEKPFWFSSQGQIVQFGAIIFCRTFKNYFGQFVWIEKKRKATIIVAFHFMKRRLKTENGSPIVFFVQGQVFCNRRLWTSSTFTSTAAGTQTQRGCHTSTSFVTSTNPLRTERGNIKLVNLGVNLFFIH